MKNSIIPTDPKSSSHQSEVALEKSFQDLYLKKDFKGAANLLIQNKQQMNSGIFHYNLGTVYSKTEEFAAARFHFEKAIKDGYINSQALNNLLFVKTKLQVDDLSTSTSIPDQIMNSALLIPRAGYFSMSLILIIMAMFFMKMNKIKNYFAIATIALVISLPVIFYYGYLENVNYAIALKEINLYEGPSQIFSEKGKIKPGSKIILGEFKEGWFLVKYPITLTGWINKDQLGIY